MTTTDELLAVNLPAIGTLENTWGTGSGGLNEGLAKLSRAAAGYLSKSVAGSANVTLTQTESENLVIELTGTLTGSIEVRPVNAGEKLWVVFNNTSGSFTVTFVPSGASGVVVPQGRKVLLYSNGTNVVAAYDWASIFYLGDGAVGAPALTFAADPDNGLYRIGTNNLGIATAGAKAIDISAAGEVTMPLQPAFLAINSATDLNVTGNGTAATVDYDTEIFDQGGDFASDTFTAPVTGRYRFSAYVRVSGLTASHTRALLELVTSNRSLLLADVNIGAVRNAANEYLIGGSILTDMDAADTAFIRLTITGAVSDDADVEGAATTGAGTTYSGELVA